MAWRFRLPALGLICACTSNAVIDSGLPAETTDASISDAATDSAAAAGKVVTLAFGADFARGTGCRAATVDTLNLGCDIYTATLDTSSGKVSNVRRLTSADEPELFPALGDNGRVYFNVYSGTATSIGYVVGDKKGTLLAASGHPSIAADGVRFVYGESTGAYRLKSGALSADGTTVTNQTLLTGEPKQLEPKVAGDSVIFYQLSTGDDHSAQGRLFNLTSKLTIDFTDKDGSAHCTLSPSGSLGTCNNASQGGILGRTINNGALGETKAILPLKSAAEMAKIDPDYAGCTSVAFNYPSFCGDDTHLVVSVACGVGTGAHGSNGTRSKLFVVDISAATPRFTLIGDALATQFGGPGKDSLTAACR